MPNNIPITPLTPDPRDMLIKKYEQLIPVLRVIKTTEVTRETFTNEELRILDDALTAWEKYKEAQG